MSYLTLDHDDRRNYTRKTVTALKKSGLEFKSIVCTGLSGVLVAPTVAEKLDKNLVIVRKGEPSHGAHVEQHWRTNVGDYVIIDDFVESGATIKRVQRDLDRQGNLVGVFFYRQGAYDFLERFREKFGENIWVGHNERF